MPKNRGRRPKTPVRGLSATDRRRLLQKWRAWSHEIVQDVGQLLWMRRIYLDLNEVGRHNAAIAEPSAFLDWIRENYAASVSIGIRRVIDTDRRSISLGRLLYEMIEHPGAITREDHLRFYGDDLHRVGQRSFDNLAGKGAKVLSVRAVRSDLRALENASERVWRFVNKRIAHRARRGSVRRLPTWADLHRALDTIDKIAVKYHILLTAEGYSTTYAVPQFNWMEVLFHPWIPPGHPLRGPA